VSDLLEADPELERCTRRVVGRSAERESTTRVGTRASLFRCQSAPGCCAWRRSPAASAFQRPDSPAAFPARGTSWVDRRRCGLTRFTRAFEEIRGNAPLRVPAAGSPLVATGSDEIRAAPTGSRHGFNAPRHAATRRGARNPPRGPANELRSAANDPRHAATRPRRPVIAPPNGVSGLNTRDNGLNARVTGCRRHDAVGRTRINGLHACGEDLTARVDGVPSRARELRNAAADVCSHGDVLHACTDRITSHAGGSLTRAGAGSMPAPDAKYDRNGFHGRMQGPRSLVAIVERTCPPAMGRVESTKDRGMRSIRP